MRHRLLPLLLALVALPCGAADTAPAAPGDPPAVTASAAPTVTDAVPSVAELRAALPTVDQLVERDGGLWWDDGKGSSYRVLAVDDKGGARLDTEIGAVAVARRLLADARVDALAALPRLVAQAQSGGAKGPEYALAEGIMTGIHLRSPEVLVLPEGVLRKQAVAAADRGDETATVARAVEEARATLEKSPLDPAGRRAVQDVLRRLALTDDAEKFDYDEVLPSFARRVARHGWLTPVLREPALATRLEQAIAAAERMQPISQFEGAGLRLAEVRNAWGQGGWVLTTPARTSYARPHPAPMYLWNAKDLGLMAVVDLPAGSDPMTDGAKAVSARVFKGSTQLLAWSREKGLEADTAQWRQAVPERSQRTDDHIAANFLPPHAVIADLDGDVHLLATAHGVLAPPRDGGKAEAERFLKDAARALPDAAHLDLIGEHLFYYVYDSPDSRFPLLLGNKQVKGDIHQTAEQTIATVSGGLLRGDCDDLSELYQEIAERQGRTAHIVSLPAHAALAFAEKKGEKWHVFVLQTGQPREFADADLRESLRQAYLSFDESDTFDPNGLGLLLRFSGENTRGPWRLSWRIFAEPEYAKTMIDVQKDWHYSTYQRGIQKMLKLIADGDDDTANYRELSGLYSFTGQYAKAVEYHRKALERTPDPESRLYSGAELVTHLADAGDAEGARAEAARLIDQDFPKLQKQLGPRAMQFGFSLAGATEHAKAWDVALRVVRDTLLEDMSQQIEQVTQWLASPRFNKRQWEGLDQLRRLQQMYVGTAVGVLEGIGPAGLPGDATTRSLLTSVQQWLNGIAFHDVDDEHDILARYATAGAYYAAVLGEERLLAMLAGQAMPEKAEHEHAKRVGGLAQVPLDLPWIRMSVPFWFMRIGDRFDRERATLDKPGTIAMGKALADAYERCLRLGFDGPFLDHQAHLGGLITALLAEDEAALRVRLRFVKEKDDKRLRDDTAQWLGDVARFLPAAWWDRVVQCWVEELDYKPKYFWIAWRAALTGGPERALAVAKVAAERYRDDPAFAEEYAFMTSVLATPAPVPATPAPEPAKVETHR